MLFTDKKIKSKMRVIALTLAVILALSFFATGNITYAMSPELSIKLAAKKTMDNLMKDYLKMESLLFGNMKSSKSHSINMNLSIEDADHTDELVNQELYLLEGMGVDISSIFDDAKKEFIFNGKYQIGGEDLISLMFKLDDNELQITIPELFERVLSVPSKNFGEEWNKSVFGQQSGVLNNNIDISLSNLQENYSMRKMNDETKNAYISAVKSIFKDAIYKDGGNTSLKIGNDHKKVNKTIITLQEDSVKEGIIAWYDANKIDNRSNYWIDIYNQDIYSNELDEVIDGMQDYVREELEMDSLTINLYTYNGNIVRSEMELVVDKELEDGTLYCNIDLLGEKSLIDDFMFEVIVGNEKFLWESKGNHTGNNGMFLDDTRILFTSPYGEEFVGEFSTEIELKKEKDNFKSNISLILDGEEMNVSTLGDFSSSTKSLAFKSEDIKFSFKDYNNDILELTFNLDLKMGDIANNPDLGNYEKLELFKLDENELNDFADLIEENAFLLGVKFREHFGY